MAFRTLLSLCAMQTALAARTVKRGSRSAAQHMRNDDIDMLPPHEPTPQNCTCRNSCGATSGDTWRCDWCNTRDGCGDWRVNGGNWDYCSLAPVDEFDRQSAAEKLQSIWNEVTSDTNPGPKLSLVGVLQKIVTQSMITVMDNSREQMVPGRVKVIHGQGVMLQFDLEVEESSPWTGIFRPGVSRGLMRLGSALPPSTLHFPGIGIKFLRDGIHSANTVALRETGDSSGEQQFFEVPLTNHVAPPSALNALMKFDQAAGCSSMTGLSDLCAYRQDGTREAALNFPWEIRFVPVDPMQFPIDPDHADRDTDLLRVLSSIPSGTALYTVHAKASPSDGWVRFARIVTRSAATTSHFGDVKLAFRHQRMDEDFHKHPEWISGVDKPACDSMLDREGNLRPLTDFKCPGADGIPPP